jgi:hypothetical protein
MVIEIFTGIMTLIDGTQDGIEESFSGITMKNLCELTVPGPSPHDLLMEVP